MPNASGVSILPCWRRDVLALAPLLVVLSGAALAQLPADSYPAKPVTIIIPVTPGGSVDTESRLYGQKLSESMGRSFVLDYKPGAGTTLGAAYVARAPADGYTLLAVSTGFVIAPSFYKNLPYDPEKDIAPISQMTSRPTAMAATMNLPINTPSEYMAYTKANPGKLNLGTTGVGGSLHLAGLWLDSASGGKVTYIHYKGTGSMMSDLIAGRVHVAPLTIPAALPHVRAGKLKIIGLSTGRRSPALPDMPTFAEQGATGYDYSGWLGFATTAGTSPAIVNKLRAELLKAGNAPDIRKKMLDDGATMVLSTPAEYAAVIKADIARWRKLLENETIKAEE